MTFKVVLGLEWITKSSLNPGLVLKVDDDVMVNPVKVWQLFEKFKSPTRGQPPPADMMGTQIASKAMRNPEAKWFLPVEFYEVT